MVASPRPPHRRSWQLGRPSDLVERLAHDAATGQQYVPVTRPLPCLRLCLLQPTTPPTGPTPPPTLECNRRRLPCQPAPNSTQWPACAHTSCATSRAAPTSALLTPPFGVQRRPPTQRASLRHSSSTCFTAAQLEHFFFNRDLTPLDVNRGQVRLLGPPAFDDAEPEDVGFLYSASLPVYGSCVVQSSLSPATRDRYQAWVTEWCQLCQRAGVPPLPVKPYALALWVELLIGAYAGSSVNVALSAVITWSNSITTRTPS